MKNNDDSLKIEFEKADPSLSEFYMKLLDKLQKDWEAQKYDEVLDRLEEELDQPYLPPTIEQMLSEAYDKYCYLKIDKVEDKYNKMSGHELILHVVVDSQFNPYLFELFLNKYGQEFKPEYTNTIQMWLHNDQISNEDKFNIIDMLHVHGVNKTLIYHNPLVDQEIVLNTQEYVHSEEIKPYNDVLHKIDEHFMKDPSANEIASTILYLCTVRYFPTFPFQSTESLFLAICEIFSLSMSNQGADYQQMNDDEKLVYKVIEANQRN